jgi:hypothetical protein
MPRGRRGQRDSRKSACSKIFVMNNPNGREPECNEGANKPSGLVQGGVKIMAIPYKKDKALCSPTSALEKKSRMLSEELRNPSRRTDSITYSRETTLGSWIFKLCLLLHNDPFYQLVSTSAI